MTSKRKAKAVSSTLLAAALPLLLGIVLFAGCAPVASKSVTTSPAGVSPHPTTTPTSEATHETPAGDEAAPAATDVAASTSAETEDDVQPAEEVEPSPLDELPETTPEVSQSTLEQDKNIVADAFPDFDIPMVLNDQVVAYVEYFKNPHHDFFAASLVRSGRYVEIFQSAFEAAGLPKDLVFMAHVESAFKTNAYSRSRAKGIFQFIAGTGRRYGLRIDSWVDERSDPEKSARAAAAYLKDLYGMFGDWYLALAAYNAGEGKIQRSLAQTKKSDFWQLASTRSLRAETKNYVPAILAATLIAKSPQKFGFDVQPDTPVATDVVTIQGQTDLRVLAKLAGVDPDTIRGLNPQLRRGVTPPGSESYVRVPAGLGTTVAQAYAELPAADRMVLARHHVEKGESLGAIAGRYGVSATAIARANNLGKAATVRPGQDLVIPAVVAAAPAVDGARKGSVAYRVRKGDTLSEIARNYRSTPAAIAEASGIGLHSQLSVGQKLIVPAKGHRAHAPAQTATRGDAPAPAVASKPVVHTVRRGETLYRIADQYQVTVDQICALNRITADGVLYPGTRLKIRTN
jgi:membrane-bound lytic murein transglycosylase D